MLYMKAQNHNITIKERRIFNMKKALVLLTSLITALCLCSCTENTKDNGSSSADVSGTNAVSDENKLPDELPDDLKCIEVRFRGKKSEVSDEVSDRLTEILKNSYKSEVSGLEQAIAIFYEIEFSNGMKLVFDDTHDHWADFVYYEAGVHKIVNVSADDYNYVSSIVNELFSDAEK